MPLTASMLAAVPPQERKTMLGEQLFPLIKRMQPEFAAKITGMLLELDNSELLGMLESSDFLRTKVEEAIVVLQNHQANVSALHGVEEDTAITQDQRVKHPHSDKISGVPQSDSPLNASVLAAVSPEEQKQMLGERLFAQIQRMQPDYVGKITGMLLELDNPELLNMLEFPESLRAKVEEAIAVLQTYQAKEPAVQDDEENIAVVQGQRIRHPDSNETPVVTDSPMTASMLAAVPPEEQKQLLGNRLFPLIQRMYDNYDMVGKITGMLLELDNSQLLHMLEFPGSLRAKVEEAVTTLQVHKAKQSAV